MYRVLDTLSMESNIQSSFIPQDAGKPVSLRRGGSSGLADLTLMLAILAFAASAALSGGVFIYNQYETATASSALSQLQQKEKEFQPQIITQLRRLDNRMQAAQVILASHIAPSVFFDILNQITAKTITYSSLTFDASNPKQIKLELDGSGQSVNSIAFQSNLLEKSGVFQTPIFSNLDHQTDGVHFHLSAFIDSSTLSFEKLTASQPVSVAPVAPASSSTAPTSPFGSPNTH